MKSHLERVMASAGAAVAVTIMLMTAAAASGQERAPADQSIEEVVVIGRYYDAAAVLVEERKDASSVINVLGADAIGRVGDSSVAAALRRVSGLTVVADKFVYVRGLGERYSSTTLNGARVPSVDLTRNVIPLNLFPTSVVESLRVQKSYSADQAAAFGGGNVDIRTKGLPDGLVFGVEVGSAYNDQTQGKVLSYRGGDDDRFGKDDGSRALSRELRTEVDRFRGDIGVQNILNTLRAQGAPETTFQQAQLVNRELALLLNRDISLREQSAEPDIDLKAYVGNNFFVTDDLEVGFVGSGAYGSQWRESIKLNRNFRFPDDRTDEDQESTYSVSLTANANLGVRYADEHEVVLTSLFLRNTDDETSVRTFFNENRLRSDGLGFLDVRFEFEQREILVNQLRGDHRFGLATKDLLSNLSFVPKRLVSAIPDGLEVAWFYSDSDATTEIPNRVNVAMEGRSDLLTGRIQNPVVRTVAEAADYRFTELNDEVQDYGWTVMAPWSFGDSYVELSGGYQHTRQARIYEQVQFALGLFGVQDQAVRALPLGEVFADSTITNPRNSFELRRAGANNESYIAATMSDAWFAAVDWTWQETWRLAAGVRWENYRQLAVDFNPFGFGVATPVVTTDPDVLLANAFSEAEFYPAISLTWMSDFLAETFQLRFGYSETVTRPDLREITNASYVDPLTDDLVFGNPGVVPAKLKNYDIRAEWFFSGGDNFTMSLFYKEIDRPIEFFESPASDTNIAREIVNAESAEIYGVEFELLKELGFLHPRLAPWFLQANLTLQQSELVAGPRANSPTNAKRDLTNAAPFVANLQLGYDSPGGQHAATLIYNVFGERLFVAGRNGAPDGFEQPFHSVDATYSWFPGPSLSVKAKAQNLLGESVHIERQGVTTFEEEVGRTFSLSVQWDL
ncbi:MAG: TonB-dependent receptor domain-containing protein [Pseudomonadales bacterium]